MNFDKKIIFLLNRYISEYKQLCDEYNNKLNILTLYDELINILVERSFDENSFSISILFNSIYGNDIYEKELYKIIYKENNSSLMNEFIEKVKFDYLLLKEECELLKNRIDRNCDLFNSAKRVKTAINYKTIISVAKNDVYNTKRIISYYEMSGVISNKEELLLLNELELHNMKVENKKGKLASDRTYIDNLYKEIPNILSIGFQNHDVIEVSDKRKYTLDAISIKILDVINTLDVEKIEEYLNNYNLHSLESSEYNYVIIGILNSYLDELITLYELLMDSEVYRNVTERMDVIKNYYITLEKYLVVKNYYNKITEFVPVDSSNNDMDLETVNEKKLIFSHSNVNPSNSKFMADMDDIPYEYYDTVIDLISRFKTGELQRAEIKTLKNAGFLKGVIELRYDQVRIVMKHVKDDVYNVFGVFAKKDDNDIPMYRIMANRAIPDVSNEQLLEFELELSKNVENKLSVLVKEKGRKGTR